MICIICFKYGVEVLIMQLKPSFLVICGDGVNCEKETQRAFELAGASADILHINEILKQPNLLHKYQGLAFPGGFSFGDDLGSGQIFSLKIKYGFWQDLQEFLSSKKPIIGICNGFQMLVRLGLLPDKEQERSFSLVQNSSGKFIDRWVGLKVNTKSHCIWTKGLADMELPVRHGEGRIFVSPGREKELLTYLQHNQLIALSYKEDINASLNNIAGLTDPSGLVLGLMPHPEAAVSPFLAPEACHRERFEQGIKLFENAVNFVRQN